MNLANLYGTQYNNDRRKQVLPIEIERRTGVDRRNNARIEIDQRLKQDINKARAILEDFKPDVFVKTGSQRTSTTIKQAEQVPSMAALYVNSAKNLLNIKNENRDNDNFLVETSLAAAGAGIGLVLPLLAGVSSPLLLTATTIVGIITSSILGNKAIDFYNYKNPK